MIRRFSRRAALMHARESNGLWRKIRELEHTGETWRESIISSCCSTSPNLSNRMRTDRSETKHAKTEDLGKMCDAWLKRCVNEWLYVTRFSADLVTVVTSPIPGSTKPTSLCSFITRGKLEEEFASFVLMLRFAIFSVHLFSGYPAGGEFEVFSGSLFYV